FPRLARRNPVEGPVCELRRGLRPRQIIEEVPGALQGVGLGAQHGIETEPGLDLPRRLAVEGRVAVEVGDQVGPVLVAQRGWIGHGISSVAGHECPAYSSSLAVTSGMTSLSMQT